MKTWVRRALQSVGIGPLWLGIIAFIGLGGWALSVPVREGIRLDQEVTATRERLAELERLYPLYVDLIRLRSDEQWAGVPCPPKQELGQEEVIEVPARFSAMARSCGMELVSLSPQVVSLPTGKRQLKLDVAISGPYARLPVWMRELLGLPAMEQMESMEVRREAIHEVFRCSFGLALN